MAPKRKIGKIRPTEPKEVPITVQVDAKPETPFYYVNFLAVNHSPYDFTISALRLPSQLTPEQKEYARKSEPVPMEPTLQLIIPTHIIKGLIKALSIQCQKYEAKYGTISSKEDGHEKNQQ
ncbi:MAG: hypothetical protein A3H27_13055 [Acidobacteria bacterium RIFCSPLOWO2_02_FULL_59_13]|nr:MAG: hypothetical protein A3H27_13055 [Acidobacteria bacterium RIFCSPLOWO2_02_FULL_59_13]